MTNISEKKRDEPSMKGWNDSKTVSGATYVEGVAAGRKAQRNPPTTGFSFEDIVEVCARTCRTFRNNHY
jgi:hypothetical protein